MKYARWNFEANDDAVSVCKDEHDKGQPCEYVELSPHEIVEILNDMRSQILRLNFAIGQLNEAVR